MQHAGKFVLVSSAGRIPHTRSGARVKYAVSGSFGMRSRHGLQVMVSRVP